MDNLICPSDEGPLVALAVGMYLCAIGVEYVAARASGRSVHRFADSIANLACGAAHQLANVYYAVFVVHGYEILRHRFSIASIEQFLPLNTLALFLLFDFLYYWEHRVLHRYRVFWATHVVHHQSREFNFTVALRVSILQVWMTTMFLVPLAVLGFSPAMVLTVAIVSKFYQFWPHTRLIKSLGVLEWVLVSPSHHRVHHARNPQYVDKNFGAMFIVWDRIFGTFEPEREAPEYGVSEPAPSRNSVMANLRPWLGARCRATASPSDGLQPEALGVPEQVSAVLRTVAIVGLMIALLLTGSAEVGRWLAVLPIAFVWLWQHGQLLDRGRANWPGDLASVALALATDLALSRMGAGTPLLTGALTGGSLLVLLAGLRWGRSAGLRADRRVVR